MHEIVWKHVREYRLENDAINGFGLLCDAAIRQSENSGWVIPVLPHVPELETKIWVACCNVGDAPVELFAVDV